MDTNARNFVRTAVLATLAAGSFLIASRPARADSVTPERALLGRVDVPDDASAAPKTWAAVSPDEHLPRVVDGQGALLIGGATRGVRRGMPGAVPRTPRR